jgi:hypothetical protein
LTGSKTTLFCPYTFAGREAIWEVNPELQPFLFYGLWEIFPLLEADMPTKKKAAVKKVASKKAPVKKAPVKKAPVKKAGTRYLPFKVQKSVLDYVVIRREDDKRVAMFPTRAAAYWYAKRLNLGVTVR